MPRCAIKFILDSVFFVVVVFVFLIVTNLRSNVAFALEVIGVLATQSLILNRAQAPEVRVAFYSCAGKYRIRSYCQGCLKMFFENPSLMFCHHKVSVHQNWEILQKQSFLTWKTHKYLSYVSFSWFIIFHFTCLISEISTLIYFIFFYKRRIHFTSDNFMLIFLIDQIQNILHVSKEAPGD